MTIECVILWMLGRESMAGYDLKKRIQSSPIMPWSGNNNQIYKALSALLDEGLVAGELHHQDKLPSRKVYTITHAGRVTLREWLGAAPEMMELRKPFLIQLSCVGEIGARKADELLCEYIRQLRAQLALHAPPSMLADEADFEAALSWLVEENIRRSYQAELTWAVCARESIALYVEMEADLPCAADDGGGSGEMRYEAVERNGVAYLRYRPAGKRPQSVDAAQFVADCIERHASRVMLYERALPEDFFNLRTGLTGAVMQKLAQYRVKAALVLEGSYTKGKFADVLIEANRGGAFHSFGDEESAERWLAGEDV